eukprot:TRINITY_DN15289_c0_g1_i1.p1 TRINITY_DN15289_c0_g1~~TRINITY_DN15289_c0_g1_i1.p1  ORF type:complete len:418 (-),score=89.27 TRINITY_DN15289_c0_g1_i1:43-1296(-)
MSFAAGVIAVALIASYYLTYTQDDLEKVYSDKYFSYSYKEARSTVLSKASLLEKKMELSVHSLPLERKGREGEELATDIIWLGSRNPKKVLFHSSGVHGVEGYAGSAVQSQILDFFLDHPDHLNEDVAVVIIHAVNPFGMSWWRRWNENNVDLNRNLLTPEEWKTREQNVEYEKLTASFNHHDPYSLTLDFFWCAVKAIGTLGFSGARQALVGGQYSHPAGLFYGGKEVQPSLINVVSFLKEHFASAESYIAIDVHTGLGPSGHDSVFVDDIDSVWAKKQGDHIVPHLYKVAGGFPEGLQLLFTDKDFVLDPTKVTDTEAERVARTANTKIFQKTTQEFGTLHGILVANALYEENFCHQKGQFDRLSPLDLISHPTKKKLLSAFYRYQDVSWKISILARGKFLFDTNLEILQSGSGL